MVFAAIMRAEERIRTRIHNFRMPIKNKRTLFVVHCLYFVTPVVLGSCFMQWIIPSEQEMRARIKPPTPEEQALIDAQKRRLQQQMDDALERRRQHASAS